MRGHAALCGLLIVMAWGLDRGARAGTPAVSGDIGLWQGRILSRPLFSPSRRPAPDLATPGGTPRLAGVIDQDGTGRAIFVLPGRDRGLIVPVGGTIGVWKIVSIAGNRVTILENGQTRQVQPDRNRLPSGPAPSDPHSSSLAPTDSSGFAPPASPDNDSPGMPQ